MRGRSWIGLWVMVLICGESAAQDRSNCAEQARTPLEQTYCKVRAANPAAALPSLQEFRRNPEKTQRLLLRRPAEQAGITLPPETQAKAKPPASPPPAPQASNNAFVRSAAVAKESSREKLAEGSLSECELRETIIRCGGERYQLQGNQPNRRLSRGALDPDNPVMFAEYQGAPGDAAELHSYAAETYRHYIDSMLNIGLGASTMSFTKFYHTLMDAQAKGTKFGKRMSEMFVFLKKDKAALGVQSHYNNALPEGIHQCMRLSDQLIVCDDVQQNWVYMRSGA